MTSLAATGGSSAHEPVPMEQFPAPAGTDVADVDLYGVNSLRVVAAGAAQMATMLHFHGGGYVLGPGEKLG